jgi:hypothetical protein
MIKHSLISLFLLAFCIGSIAQFKHGDTVFITSTLAAPGGYRLCARGASLPSTIEFISKESDFAFKSSLWRVEISGKSYYSFYNLSIPGYLGIDRGSAVNGEKTAIKSSRSEDTQWRLLKTNNTYKLKNLRSGFLLTRLTPSSNTSSREEVVQKTETTGDRNAWMIDKYNTPPPPLPKRKTIVVSLRSIGVSEATRNRVDNLNCKMVFGFVKAELFSLNDDGSEDKQIPTSSIADKNIFSIRYDQAAAYAGYSYYENPEPIYASGASTFSIDTGYFKSREFILKITSYLGSRHKDNVFASDDALKMNKPSIFTFKISGKSGRSNNFSHKMQLDATNRPGEAMIIAGSTVPPEVFRGDDNHKFFLRFTVEEK